MSRSYKKASYSGDKKNKENKRNANKKVRNFLKNNNYCLNRKNYKKVFDSYDICDFGWLQSWGEYWENKLKNYQEHPEWYKNPPNKKEEYRYWYKHYRMK